MAGRKLLWRCSHMAHFFGRMPRHRFDVLRMFHQYCQALELGRSNGWHKSSLQYSRSIVVRA